MLALRSHRDHVGSRAGQRLSEPFYIHVAVGEPLCAPSSVLRIGSPDVSSGFPVVHLLSYEIGPVAYTSTGPAPLMILLVLPTLWRNETGSS